MNTTITATDPEPKERFIPSFLKLIISFVVAFIGFSFAIVVILFIGFLAAAIKENSNDGIPLLFVESAVFSASYGVFTSIALAIPFSILGIPAALIGWKLKLIRWWTSLIGAMLLSISPIALIIILNIMARFLFRERLPDASEITANAGFLLAACFCGMISGLCFWLVLRLLRFSNITGPIDYLIRFQNNVRTQ